jgi:hypothetical protein
MAGDRARVLIESPGGTIELGEAHSIVPPGLQYAAAPRFVIEGSIQLPVVRNTGAFVLRNDRNILLGVRYLF